MQLIQVCRKGYLNLLTPKLKHDAVSSTFNLMRMYINIVHSLPKLTVITAWRLGLSSHVPGESVHMLLKKNRLIYVQNISKYLTKIKKMIQMFGKYFAN